MSPEPAAPAGPRPSPRRTGFGIGLRIYVVTVAVVLASAAALGLALRLVSEREVRHRGPLEETARYAAGRLAQRWSDPAAVQEELRAMKASGLRAAAYDAAGRLVAATDPGSPLPPPPPEFAASVRRDGGGELDCPGLRCRVAARIDVAPRGLLLLAPADRVFHGHRLPPEIVLLALLLVGVAIAAVVLGSSVARPLDRIARTAHALGSGDLAARTGLSRHDEVGAVARAFDDMADRVAALVRAQTELVANVAHELRTPLARIHVALDLAADGGAEEARDSLAEIAEDLAELERLVDDVLAASRMELAATGTGAPPLRRARLQLAAVVEAAAERFRGRHPARTLVVERAEDLPEIEGDAVLLRRALDNLLDNAGKYSAADREIRLRAAPGPGGGATIEVIDRGEGIAPEDLARLFTPFFRADRSRARTTGGVGLGLALSRRIAEAHGGTLTAASTPGVGTTMTLTLPAAHGARTGEPTVARGSKRG